MYIYYKRTQTIKGENGSAVTIVTTTKIVKDKLVTSIIKIGITERQAINQVIEELNSFEEVEGVEWVESVEGVKELKETLKEATEIIQKQNKE